MVLFVASNSSYEPTSSCSGLRDHTEYLEHEVSTSERRDITNVKWGRHLDKVGTHNVHSLHTQPADELLRKMSRQPAHLRSASPRSKRGV